MAISLFWHRIEKMCLFFLRSHGIPENGVVHVPGLLVALFGTVTEIHQKQGRGHGAHARNSCETNEKLTQEERQNKKKKKSSGEWHI